MKKYLKIAVVLGLVGGIVGGSIGLYMFFMPHRDVQSAETDFQTSATALVNEFLTDATAASDKYISEDGDSKIVEVSGNIASISKDFNGQTVVLLKSETDKAGVSCTLLPEAESHLSHFQVGSSVILKGVVRGGASFDSDLDLYENVLLADANFITEKH